MSQICLSVSFLSVSLQLFGAFCLVCSQTRRYPFFAYLCPRHGGELPASFHHFGWGSTTHLQPELQKAELSKNTTTLFRPPCRRCPPPSSPPPAARPPPATRHRRCRRRCRHSVRRDMRRRPSRSGRVDKGMGGTGAVSRCDTTTSRCKHRGGVEEGHVRRQREDR